MGTDNDNKRPLNYRTAQCVLHCNNCITLLLALVLLVFGLFTSIDSTNRAVKLTLCSSLEAAGLHPDDLMRASNRTRQGILVESLCRPSGDRSSSSKDVGSGHCNPWKQNYQNRHADCMDGYYCDEDFVCWDCDYVTPSLDDQGNEIARDCDAFDALDPKYSRMSIAQLASDGPCARCLSTETNPERERNNSVTVEQSMAAPDGADFLGWPSDISIGFGIVVIISSIFGFLGDAFKRRTLLFIHHFILLLLGIAMIYAVAVCLAFKQYAHDMLRTYWPWVQFSLKVDRDEAQELLSERLGTIVVLCVMITMSLWSGVVASARLLGLQLLAKQMLIMTNALTLIFSLTLDVATFVAYISGYAATSVLVILFLGFLSFLVGLIGFIGAATERAGFLRAQMYLTVPLVVLLFIGALEALIWDKAHLREKAKALAGSLGKMAPNVTVDILEVHFILVGLMALMLVVLVVLNLCCTRILVQRLSVDGRYYEQVSVEDDDLEDDYGMSNDVSNARRRNANDAHSLEMQNFAISEEQGVAEQPQAHVSGHAGAVGMDDVNRSP